MGNASASRSAVSSIPRSETASYAKYGESLSSRKQSKNVGSKLPPLHVIKDSSVQTDGNPSISIGSGIAHAGRLLIFMSILYFGVCYLIICSDYVQSLIVYSHYVKEEQPLTELHKIGLPEARNIEIITEDGMLLRGWHLMNPGEELLKANALEESERNSFFDHSLAFSNRVVIYFHGNSQTRAQAFRLRKVKQLAVYLNAHVIAFDYRGFADSEGYPSEAGTHLDARAVVHYVDNIVRRYNPRALGYITPLQSEESSNSNTASSSSNDVISATEGLITRLFDLLQVREAAATAAASAAASIAAAEANMEGDRGSEISKPIVDANVLSGNSPKEYKQPKLFIYGHSLGAAISTAIAVEVSNIRPGALSGLILDCPFTSLPEAIRFHPLTTPFRAFPLIFNAMVTNLQYKYSSIDRIQQLSTPVMLLHGEQDIKINVSHSRSLFLKATAATALLNETASQHYGLISKSALIRPADGVTASQNGTVTCSYPVEWHVLRDVGHNEVYASRDWLTLLPSFVNKAESFAAENDARC